MPVSGDEWLRRAKAPFIYVQHMVSGLHCQEEPALASLPA